MQQLIIWFASHTEDYGYNLANGALVSINYNVIESFTERVYMEDNVLTVGFHPSLIGQDNSKRAHN